MPKVARLILAPHPTQVLKITAYNLDTKKECLIPAQEISALIKDCHDWDVERLAAGIPFQVTMAASEWAQWLAHYQVGDNSHLFITVDRDGEFNDCLSAVALRSAREVIASADEAPNLAADCHGWDDASFDDDQSVVAWISCADWDAWLEMFEVCDRLSDDTAALLEG